MRRSQQVKSRRSGKAQRIGAVFTAVLVAFSLATLLYQPPVEAGVTTFPGNIEASALSQSGGNHICAVANSAAYCWGQGANGQLGNGGNGAGFVGYAPVSVDATGVLADKTVTAISAGTSHTCAIANGQAYCWGSGANGRLGRNSTAQSPVPVAVTASGVLSGKTVTAISAGNTHTCAIADGAAYCWGAGTIGRLGNNSTDDSLVPVAVTNSGVLSGKTVTAISAGTSHTCAIADGAAYCWGIGTNGRLGNNSVDDSLVPVAVTASGVLSGKTVTAISAGGSYTCAIADGAAYCWGDNFTHRLGDGTTTHRTTPVAVRATGSDVLNGKTVTAISAGSSHTCAIADGQVYCWGSGTSGQLGNGSYTGSGPVAAPVRSFDTPLNNSSYRLYENANSATPGAPLAGVDGSAQLTTTGEAFRLRQGINNGISSGGGNVTDISAGTDHACAIADGQAYCWGSGANGRLGNNSTADSLVPVPVDTSGVLAGKTVTAVSAGTSRTCAIADGAAYCWGAGSLGNNSTDDSLVPVAVSTSGVLNGKTVTNISAAGGPWICVLADNAIYCWGSNVLAPVAMGQGQIPSDAILQRIDGTSYLTYGQFCVVASSGNGYCWVLPVATNPTLQFSNISQVSVGMGHGCFLLPSDWVSCSGEGAHGQLGNGSTVGSQSPVLISQGQIPVGATIQQVSVDARSSCAIADGLAYCWGDNTSGQLGNNSTAQSNIPSAVDASGALAGKAVTAISVSAADYVCAVADGAVYCWGDGANGRLGDNSTSGSLVPVATGVIGSVSFPGSTIIASANTFVLQHAVLSAATCSLQTTGFAAVTAATPISYNTNASVSNGAAITAHTNDPTDNAETIPLTYRSAAGNFTNAVDIPPGHTGLFDFSLRDNGASANTTYCLRIAYSDGSPIENATAYAEITMANGFLQIEIVDGSDNVVASPSFAMSATTAQTACQSVSGMFGTSAQRIRVLNSLSSAGWSVNIAATNGPTAAWSSGGSSYDFNDPSGSPSGCNSGSDGDGIAGRLTLNPAVSTLTPQSGCAITGLSKGSLAGFDQGVLDSITLLTASAATPMNCYYYITEVDMLQYIPANQPAGSYSIDMTTTVVAQ